MKEVLFLITIMFVSISGIAQQTDNRNIETEFDKLLAAEFKPDGPGAVVLVSKEGKVVYKKAFGMANLEWNSPMQTDNVFWIASIGKQFTAIAILQLIEQGKLNLQDEITRFIPDYPTQGTKITIEHLLTHTSGIHNFSGMPDPEKKLALDCTPEEVINFFKNMPMRFTPGTKWEYSNSGYFLLGYIIEKITGKPYSNYLEEHFFKPLGMNHSSYANDKKIIKNRVGSYSVGKQGLQNATSRNITHVYSAGAIQSTVDDYLKWHEAIHSYKLVKKELLDRVFAKYQLQDGTKTDYGYGWRLGYVYETPSIWHGGLISGFGNIELYLPEKDVLVVIFSNCDCFYPKELASKLAAITIGKTYDYKEIQLNDATLKKYTGLYENQKGQQQIISLSENQLYSQLGRGPKSKLKPYQTNQFFFDKNRSAIIEFSRNKKGRITGLITKKLDGIEIWNITNLPLPDSNGIRVNSKILETYVGSYEVPSLMQFNVSKIKDRLFIQAKGQDSFELFAETNHKFFTKVNDAEFEFVKDDVGNVIKVILSQSGRKIEAKRVK